MKKYCIFFLLITIVNAYGQNDRQIVIGSKDTSYSSILKEQREYWVYLPPDYTDSSFSLQRFPVLYLLDGNAHFHSLTGLIQQMTTGINGNTIFPEMIIVAILNTDRTRDLTPTHTVMMPGGRPTDFLRTSGGGENFTTFLSKELIPHIDSAYHTNSYRILVGHSLGGLTAINILLNHTDLFSAYIAIDPSMWFDNRNLLKKAGTLLATKNFKNKTLFLAVANTMPEGMDYEKVDEDTTSETEHIRAIRKLAYFLSLNKNNGLRWNWQYFGNEDHGSVPLIAEYDGLNFIFQGYKTSFSLIMKGVDTVYQHYKNLSAEFGYTILPPPRIINQAGYILLQNRDYDRAIDFFGMNIKNYPNSFAVYDSMGDAYAAKGDNPKAIEYYQKALEINPNVIETKQKLKSLAGK